MRIVDVDGGLLIGEKARISLGSGIIHGCDLHDTPKKGPRRGSVFFAPSQAYTQEIGTLIRTMAEFTTHIEFVLDPEEKDHSNIEKYVQEFFADSRRGPAAELKRAQVRQGVVHESLGRRLDDFAKQGGETGERSSVEALYSNIYRVFSNYVRGKYPEVMDMYGGTPAISDEMRVVVEELWPELAHKLPSKSQH
jgi:hypothetical protein